MKKIRQQYRDQTGRELPSPEGEGRFEDEYTIWLEEACIENYNFMKKLLAWLDQRAEICMSQKQHAEKYEIKIEKGGKAAGIKSVRGYINHHKKGKE